MAGGKRLSGKELKTLRLRSGIDINRFCDDLNFCRSNWVRVELGKAAPPGPALQDKIKGYLCNSV